VDKKPTPSVDKNMAYTPTGALTNDGKTYKDMKYDAWGRLVEVRNQSSVVQAVYRYNGLGHRITWHDDADNDADVDANDPIYHLAVTEGGSMLAVYRGSDANVKEQIYLHLRGLNGWPSTKCDGETEVIVVDADRSTSWAAAADSTAETRSYLLTNQRGDVVTLISEAGRVRERPRYSAYGVPMLIMRTDWDADGDVDSSTGAGTDQAAYEADYFAGSPPARADYNLDGSIDPDDLSDYIADRTSDAGGSYGYGGLSSAGVGNRKGFASAEHERVYSQAVVSRRSAFARAEMGRQQSGFLYLRAMRSRRASIVVPGVDPFQIPLDPITITPPTSCPPRHDPAPTPTLPDLLPWIPKPPNWPFGPSGPAIEIPPWSPFDQIVQPIGFPTWWWRWRGPSEFDPVEEGFIHPLNLYGRWYYETTPHEELASWTECRALWQCTLDSCALVLVCYRVYATARWLAPPSIPDYPPGDLVDPSEVLPPGWDENWEWGPPSGDRPGDGWRWFDPDGGEWRYHPADPWHDPHWDYNPWEDWNDRWRNIYPIWWPWEFGRASCGDHRCRH